MEGYTVVEEERVANSVFIVGALWAFEKVSEPELDLG